MKRFILIGLLGMVFGLPYGSVQAAPRVVASIPPIHSLVSGVMQGVAEPDLLLKGAVSPHHFSLRPSDVRHLHQAEVVFWVGEPLESFLSRAVAGLGPQTRVVRLLDAEGLQRLPIREGHLWEDAHEHGGAHHPAHDPAHDPHQAGGHEAAAQDEPTHGADAHGLGIDPHVWLDPHNAVVLVRRMAEVLAATDPANAPRYQANARRMTAELQALDVQLQQALAPFGASHYLVFHDAYQYLERRYGLNPAGAIAVSPEQRPGARRLADIRQRLRESAAVCVFSEPQFDATLVNLVSEGMELRHAVLDPLGTTLPPGPDQYRLLMTQLAGNLAACLTGLP